MNRNSEQEVADDARRLEAAAEWMLHLREDAGEHDIVKWVQWCEADPRNQNAFDRVRDLWQLSGALAREVVDGDLVRPAAGIDGVFAKFRIWLQADGGRKRRWLVSANALALVMLAGMALTIHGKGHRAGNDDVVASAVAESVHQAELSDGSEMELAAKSIAVVRYTPTVRGIELRDGEAYFTVAPNKERPFLVAAGVVHVRAVGTAFNVRRAGDRVVVTVTKGKVEVYRVDPKAANADLDSGAARLQMHMVRIAAGSQVSWDASDAGGPVVAAVDAMSTLGWREGRLVYTNEPLGSVIADYNRYSGRPVMIDGEGISDMRFSGTLLTRSTQEWLHALPGEFPVRLVERDGIDVIEAQSAPHP